MDKDLNLPSSDDIHKPYYPFNIAINSPIHRHLLTTQYFVQVNMYIKQEWCTKGYKNQTMIKCFSYEIELYTKDFKKC